MRQGFAPAKVNLALHVTGRRADGYHLLDSLVAFADVGDRLSVAPGDGLRVEGPFAAGVPTDDRNLIRRALSLAGASRAVTLDKQLPHPGGIGGGSSDAAAALRLAGVELSVDELVSLGADMPVCAVARASRMRGIGEGVEAVAMPALHAVLVHPGLSLPTPEVFRHLDRADNPPMETPPDSVSPEDWVAWLTRQRNDLEAPALEMAPPLRDVLVVLSEAGATLARMSGSGATCFGLWPTRIAAEDAARGLARDGWWVRACSLA